MIRNSKALLILIGLSIFSFTTSLGQTPNKFRIGAGIGLDRVYYRNYLGDNNWSLGHTSNVNLELLITERLSFLANLAYANRNIISGVVWVVSPPYVIPETLFSERQLRVLEFSPITIKYRFRDNITDKRLNPFFQMGLVTSFAVSDNRVVATDTGSIAKTYSGFKSYKQGVEFGGGIEYSLTERVYISLLLSSRLTKTIDEPFRFVPESNFDKLALQAGIIYGF